MDNKAIYLDSYVLQSDSRIRLPKAAIENLGAVPGQTRFIIYLDNETKELILKIEPPHERNLNNG